MSSTVTLSPTLRKRLAALRRRSRRLQGVHALSLLVVVLGLSGGAALLADYWLDLTASCRQVLLCVWGAAGIGGLFLGLILPLCRRIDMRTLAAVIEQKYPELGERLTSSVELAGSDTEGHGSPAFIARLMDETERQSDQLDFRPAFPARRAALFFLLAAVVVSLIAAPAGVWPRQYADLSQRFFRPWSVDSAAAYTIEVTPGDTIAGRGRTVTLSAHLVPRNAKVTLPEHGTLVVVDGEGKETREAMERDEVGDFTMDYKVIGDVSYRVEAGEAVSDAYRMTAIAPVELAAESPSITVTPPAYARAVKEEETFYGLVDLSALQHSSVRFNFHFTRPAEAAYLEWTAQAESDKNGEAEPPSSRHPLALSDDRQTASFTMPATKAGHYRVVLEAEQGIRTVLEGGFLRVRPDQPPSVVKFAGKEERTVQASEGASLEIETADDIAVAGLELEYRVNDSETVRQTMKLQGGASPSAVARHLLELSGKAQPEDRVQYRFHIVDNFPAEYGGPHAVVYPPDHWLTLRIARQGGADTEKEILTRRDEINRKLEDIKNALLKEKNAVARVRQETGNQATLPTKQVEDVNQLQEDNRSNQKALRELAKIADAEPELQPVAEEAREVADREMSESQKALDQAPQQPSPNERVRRFDKADQQLDSAVKRLEELKKNNDELAREQIDRSRLEKLAEREKQLAEKTAELAAKNPMSDPAAKEQTEKLRRQQDEVVAELDRTAQKSENLKQALEQAREEQVREMAERARDLAQAQRDLMRAEAETQRNAEKSANTKSADQSPRQREREGERKKTQPAPDDPVSELIRQQTEVARQADELAGNVAHEHGDESAPSQRARLAEQAARETARQLQAGALTRARDAGGKTVEQLRQLASRLAREPRDVRRQGYDSFAKARQLDQRQEEINRRLQTLAGDPRAQEEQQRARQQSLQEQAGALMRELTRMARQTKNASQSQALDRAAEESQKARQSMQQARARAKQGNQDAAREAQQNAAQSLDRAAREVSRTARASAGKPSPKPGGSASSSRSGRDLRQARQDMARAHEQLAQGKPGSAQSAMRQAAQALAQAAQNLGSGPQQPGQPAQVDASLGLGRSPGGLADLSALGLDDTPYAGKSWGELPGELRTKIVQDMKTRYGEDYARAIKLYFEQLADTKRK